MTVASTTTKVSYSGNGSTTVFTVPFYFLAAGDLRVILRSSAGVETVQTLTSQYTVTGAGVTSGGSVTMLTAPASGTTLTILRNVSPTQETDLLPNDRLPAESLETALDKATMLIQQLDEVADRALQYPASDAAVSAQIPAASARASKFLSFNANGLPVATVGVDATLNIFTQAGTGAVPRSINDKLRDTVSVKDFGAKGDYSNDDTVAIQNALNSGKNVYFPAGNYIVTAPLTMPITKRTVVRGDGPIETQIYYRPPASQADFMTIPDGDNIEFRDLGFLLQFPQPLIVGFQIGDDANSIRFRRCEFTYWNRAAIRHATAEYGVIEDCRFIFCTDTTNTVRSRAIWFDTYANTVTISGCRFSGNDSNIYAGGGAALRVENCSFEGDGDTANTVAYQDVSTFIGVRGLSISGNYVEGEKPAAGYAAMRFSGCNGVSISANIFAGDFAGTDITDTFLFFRDNCRGVTVENNWFNNPKDFVARWLTADIVRFANNYYSDGLASTPVTDYAGIMALMNSPQYVDLDVPFTFTYDPGSLNDGAGETSAEQTVSGVVFGDFVVASASESLQGVLAMPYVSAVNKVRIRLQNETGGTVDLGSGTWKIRVFKAY